MMIPYIHVPSRTLGPVTIHPFGVLVVTAVLVGTSLAARRARKLGLVRATSLLRHAPLVSCVLR